MSNLEPIEDKDLDLKNKFIEDAEKTNKADGAVEKESAPFILEKSPEAGKEGAVEKEQAYTKILSKVQATAQPADDGQIMADARELSEAEGEEAKIETLVKMAITKGVPHAVKAARHLEDNYALDEFHDRLLADELHDALLKKGLIKEV